MRSRPSTLTLLAAYALFATFGLSYFFVRDISNQLATERNDENLYYEQPFLPSVRRKESSEYDVSSGLVDDVHNHENEQTQQQQTGPLFPIKKHIVTHGHPRTATTLLFNMATVSYFVYLLKHEPENIPTIHLQLWKREDAGNKILKRENEKTLILKTHLSLDNFLADNSVIFTTAMDKKEAAETRVALETEGHTVAFVQDMESLKEGGIEEMVQNYVVGYGLSDKDRDDLTDYFANWEILRQCCGQQMSAKWRNDMMPQEFKRKDLPHHPNCATYDIDSIAQAFMKSSLFAKIELYPNMHPMNKPSLNDDNLHATYCSDYNHRVRTEGLSIWGQPGGRPKRTKIDAAIKDQYNIGKENLTPEGLALIESNGMREIWKLPDEEKKAWLKDILNARTVKGKSYKEYGFSTSTDANDKDDGESDEYEDEDEEEVDRKAKSKDIESSTNVQIAGQEFDNTHAIFLISFGKEAAESTLVERCILSLRRRGAWYGYIIVLTDAPPERYQNVWDANVIVMHPLEEHFKTEDGTMMQYSKDNMSLKPKRFKTFILDYIDMDPRLDSVDLVYYLDIDIMAGNRIGGLFSGVEETYGVTREERSEGTSRLYFFTPISKEWPLQGGTFIVERKTSRHCLELWRGEIDEMTRTGRGRDQDALRNIYQRIESAEETKCELIRMENENYISFPTPRIFDKLASSSYADLIHISNSVFAKRIDEEVQNPFIYDVLQLSEEEINSGRYGKSVVRAKDKE